MDDSFKNILKISPEALAKLQQHFHTKLSSETLAKIAKVGGIPNKKLESRIYRELGYGLGRASVDSIFTVFTKAAPKATKTTIKKGRPKGSGYEDTDNVFVDKAIRLFNSGEARSITAAVKKVTDNGRKLASGTAGLDNQLKRICRKVGKQMQGK